MFTRSHILFVYKGECKDGAKKKGKCKDSVKWEYTHMPTFIPINKNTYLYIY